jgi:hypothetical protein
VLADVAPDPSAQLAPWLVGLLLVAAAVIAVVVISIWLVRRFRGGRS